LKERLFSHFKMSEYVRLEKLFTMLELGVRKLSAMLVATVCWRCVPVAKKILAVHRIVSSPPAQGAKNFVGP
jgi:hypothetical protein